VLIGAAAAVVIVLVVAVVLLISRRGTGTATASSPPAAAQTAAPPPPSATSAATTSPEAAATPGEGEAAGTGSADIASTPSGAAVALAGSPVGFTPLSNLEIRVGSYPVVIVKTGYQTWSGTLVVEAGKKAELNVPLAPVGGTAPPPPPTASRPPEPPRVVLLENEVDTAPRQTSGTAVSFPANVPGPAPGQSLSVTVAFVVNEDGTVGDIQVLGSGGSALDAAVTNTIAKWRFAPGVKQGAKVPVRLSRKFTFRG
jgi:TonB family protein